LEFLERHSIANRDSRYLTAADLIEHIQSRRADGAGPATAANNLTWIGVVLRAAKSVKDMSVDPIVVEQARTACRELRLVAKSRRRDRRPTADELCRLAEYFERRDQRSEIPMRDVWEFAMASAKREDEICRLLWEDNDSKGRTGVVRDAKHPREKHGNHRRFKYTSEAWAIIQRQPRTQARIFPYNPKSVGAAFTRACQFLGIMDLHFHDGRHEGTSRLFERGYQIHEVAQFTLHESWNELKRYANLRPENVREIAATPAQSIRKSRAPAKRLPALISRPARAGDQSTQPGRRHSPATAISVHPDGTLDTEAASPAPVASPLRS
jgi:integrase